MPFRRAILIMCCLVPSLGAETITISAAISLKDAMNDISIAYEKKTGVKVALNFGSSGQLMTQILRGAPVDVFISAADEQMDRLEHANRVDPQTRINLAGNRLVMVVPHDLAGLRMSFRELDHERFKRISIGHPESVPAGKYAMQVLSKLDLIDAVRPRLVFGANARQVLSYIERGEVEAAIVYRTDALAAGGKILIAATAEAAWHEPIRYPAAVVSTSNKRESAMRFLDFIGSEPARRILASHGFASAPASEPAGPPAPTSVPSAALPAREVAHP